MFFFFGGHGGDGFIFSLSATYPKSGCGPTSYPFRCVVNQFRVRFECGVGFAGVVVSDRSLIATGSSNDIVEQTINPNHCGAAQQKSGGTNQPSTIHDGMARRKTVGRRQKKRYGCSSTIGSLLESLANVSDGECVRVGGRSVGGTTKQNGETAENAAAWTLRTASGNQLTRHVPRAQNGRRSRLRPLAAATDQSAADKVGSPLGRPEKMKERKIQKPTNEETGKTLR